MWLLADWPDRFVSTCHKARITRKDLIANRVFHPPWLDTVIDLNLTLRKLSVSVVDVIKATETIETTGHRVSKKAVRKILGVAESRAADSLFSQRRHASPKELLALCGRLEDELAAAPESRDQRATIIRDYLIFLISVLIAEPIERIVLMPEAEIRALLRNKGDQTDQAVLRKLLSDRALQLQGLYTSTARRRLLGKGNEPPIWFLARNGVPMKGHSIRERLAKIIRAHLARDLWNSADAFLQVLRSTRPASRRSLRSPYEGVQGNLF
jgi:hypothetical protein